MGVYTNTQGWYSYATLPMKANKILVTARSPKISFPILTFRDFEPDQTGQAGLGTWTRACPVKDDQISANRR